MSDMDFFFGGGGLINQPIMNTDNKLNFSMYCKINILFWKSALEIKLHDK